ncbi:hypothetical protein [Azospirillum canadense]|uniref:hypothetical protein n=1 Tax=Azospirillum canadense TaxID=403962 RepID=UPI0022262025|nr:hypothetical protein [Azospirillum canadense]MCW2239497.1 hypothetical protein [Azospirillum canadense]
MAFAPTGKDIMDDSAIPDPTYGYFLTFALPPPDVRNLPDTRTDAEAIAAAVEAAQDRAAVVHLRRHTEDGTTHLGTATPAGAFHPAPEVLPPSRPVGPDDVAYMHAIGREIQALERQIGRELPARSLLLATLAAMPPKEIAAFAQSLRTSTADDLDVTRLPVTWPPGGPKPVRPSPSGAVVISVPAGPPPFGPGSGRRFGEPRR